MNTTTVTARTTRVSWGSIFAGTFVALGIWALLLSLGLALGLSQVNASDVSSLKGAGLFTGIWGFITPLVALFLGGWVAARTSGVLDRASGIIHGAVVWSFATLIGIWVVVTALGTAVAGATQVGSSVLGGVGKAAAGAVSSGAPQKAAQSLGIDENALLGPVNQQLTAQGAPAITADQLHAVISDVAKTGLRNGKVDRAMLMTAVTRHTSLTASQANLVADQVEQSVNRAAQGLKSGAKQVGSTVEKGALTAIDTSSKAFWGIFIGLALGLISAVLGAVTGESLLYRHERMPPRLEAGLREREVLP